MNIQNRDKVCVMVRGGIRTALTGCGGSVYTELGVNYLFCPYCGKPSVYYKKQNYEISDDDQVQIEEMIKSRLETVAIKESESAENAYRLLSEQQMISDELRAFSPAIRKTRRG